MSGVTSSLSFALTNVFALLQKRR
ncbi:hypothetical protein [Nocardia sp. NPDC006630]